MEYRKYITLSNNGIPLYKVAYQNVVQGLENTHIFLRWFREKQIAIGFVGEAWIERNSRRTETHISFALMSRAKKRSRVMACVRKGMEKESEVVQEEDNHIILQEKNNHKIGGVYANRRLYVKKWKKLV